MKNITPKEIILSLLLVVFGYILLNPFGMFMPDMVHMIVLALVVVLAGLFLGLVVHEKVHDEREALHRDRSGRTGYTLGIIALLVGIILQTFAHALDTWLVVTLIVMVLGKVVSRVGSRMKG